MTLTVLDHRGKDAHPASGIIREHQADNLLLGIFHHAFARHIGISFACTSIEQAEEVVNLRRRAHRASRIAISGLLVDADYGTQARDEIHVGTFHVTQKITGIGVKRLHIATLAFGKDGVESERRLSAAAETCDYGQAFMGNRHVHILQIVYARPLYDNVSFGFWN